MTKSRFRGGRRLAAACLVSATLVAAADAQPVREILVDVAPCIAIESVLERLDCYDRLARSAGAGEQPAPAGAVAAPAAPASVPIADGQAPAPAASRAPPAAAEAAAAAAAPEATAAAAPAAAAPATAAVAADAAADADFGLPAPDERRRGRDQAAELAGEVAALREILPGRLEITLTNGQVWRQTNSDRYRLQVGYPVRIYPTRFGQYYRLTSDVIRGFVQVERIR